MTTQRMRLEAKVQYLQSELDALKDYFYVPDTYQFLIEQLDTKRFCSSVWRTKSSSLPLTQEQHRQMCPDHSFVFGS